MGIRDTYTHTLTPYLLILLKHVPTHVPMPVTVLRLNLTDGIVNNRLNLTIQGWFKFILIYIKFIILIYRYISSVTIRKKFIWKFQFSIQGAWGAGFNTGYLHFNINFSVPCLRWPAISRRQECGSFRRFCAVKNKDQY